MEDGTVVQGIKCPDCGCTKVWKVGYTPTRQGKKARYKCTECGRSFFLAKKKRSKKGEEK